MCTLAPLRSYNVCLKYTLSAFIDATMCLTCVTVPLPMFMWHSRARNAQISPFAGHMNVWPTPCAIVVLTTSYAHSAVCAHALYVMCEWHAWDTMLFDFVCVTETCIHIWNCHVPPDMCGETNQGVCNLCDREIFANSCDATVTCTLRHVTSFVICYVHVTWTFRQITWRVTTLGHEWYMYLHRLHHVLQ